MSKNKGSSPRGAEAFEEYYASVFAKRWQGLKAALLRESEPKEFKAQEGAAYFLDSASVLAAISLPLEKANKILDMCAAPGGNLPASVQERVQLSCGDGALLCKKEDASYDAILLDAPCSSERHVLNDPKYLAEWSPARVKSLAMQQWALLSSAFRILKEGGHLLYSTCALDRAENEGVAERLLKKFPEARAVSVQELFAAQEKGRKEIAPFFDLSLLPKFEEKTLGFSILPDRQGGAGPIYFCLFQKASAE